MKNRVIASGVKAREELAKGADFLADAVKSTLGPYGQNWFLDKKNTITNDGVTVAREIQPSTDTVLNGVPMNEINNRGAAALREAATKTVDEVGDGTTTSIILAQAIYHECARQLPTENTFGKKPASEVIAQVERERKEVTDKLLSMATPIETEEQLISSAIVSMGDKELGELIGKTQWKLGKEGYILAEETAERQSSVEFVRGICIDNGIGTGTLINNQEKQQLEVSTVKFVLTSYTIKTGEEWNKWIVPIANKVASMGGKELVIMARAWTELTLQLCMLNLKPDSKMKIYPINAPYVNMGEKMKDVSALTGATYFDSETTRLEDLQVSDVGYAEKVIARRMDATVTGKETPESKTRIEKRIAELEEAKKGSNSDFEKKEISKRIAQLQNGFAIVKVGSHSDMERRRLFDKTDDAVHAVRAAFQEGTVKGGGLAFKEIAEGLPNGYLLKRPLMSIYEQIISSAPQDFVIADWVRDPVKVLRVALQNACTVASSFATAGGVVTEAWDKSLDVLLRRNKIQNENTTD